MVRDKQKFALWLTPETNQKIEGHYRGDNCKSQSEFTEKAVKFYCGYLDTEGADDYLPPCPHRSTGCAGRPRWASAVQAGGG